MEKLHFLGNGNALVTECFNTCFTLSHDHRHFLFDTGGGNQILKQLKDSNISIEQIPSVFISHCHADHILGAIWILRAYIAAASKNPAITHITFYGHAQVIHTLKTLMQLLLNDKQSKALTDRLHLVTVESGDTVNDMGLRLDFFDILSTKDQQFGCRITLPSKKVVVYLGDEPYRDPVYDYAKNADYLLHEAFCLYRDRDLYKPYEKHHLTAKDASINATRLEAKKLIMIHTEDVTLAQRKSLYTEEARPHFTGPIYVPDDLEVITLD